MRVVVVLLLVFTAVLTVHALDPDRRTPFDEDFAKLLRPPCAVKRDGAIVCFDASEPMQSIWSSEGPFVQVEANIDPTMRNQLLLAGLRYDGTIMMYRSDTRRTTTLTEGGPFVQLALRAWTSVGFEHHVCGLSTAGNIACTDNTLMLPPDGPFIQLVGAPFVALCALREGGNVGCAANQHSQNISGLLLFQDTRHRFRQICLSRGSACGLNLDGITGVCFSLNARMAPEVQWPLFDSRTSPTITRITCAPYGQDGMCAVRSDRSALCWGSFAAPSRNPSMQLPYPLFVASTPRDMEVAAVETMQLVPGAEMHVALALLNGSLTEWILTPVWSPGQPNPTNFTSSFDSTSKFHDDIASDLVSPLQQISNQGSFVCGLTVRNAVRCRFYEDGPTVPMITSPFLGIQYRKVITVPSAALYSGGCVCALSLDNFVDCWGSEDCSLPGATGVTRTVFRDISLMSTGRAVEAIEGSECFGGLTDSGVVFSTSVECATVSASVNLTHIPFGSISVATLSFTTAAVCVSTVDHAVYCAGRSCDVPSQSVAFFDNANPPHYLGVQFAASPTGFCFVLIALRLDQVLVKIGITIDGLSPHVEPVQPVFHSDARTLAFSSNYETVCAVTQWNTSRRQDSVWCARPQMATLDAWQLFPPCVASVGAPDPLSCYRDIAIGVPSSDAEASFGVCALTFSGTAVCVRDSTPFNLSSATSGSAGLTNSVSSAYMAMFDYAVAAHSRWIVKLGGTDSVSFDLPFCGRLEELAGCATLPVAVALYGSGPTTVHVPGPGTYFGVCGLVLGANPTASDVADAQGRLIVSASPLGLTITSPPGTDSNDFPVVDCEGRERFAVLSDGTRLAVSGLSITNGRAPDGSLRGAGGAFAVQDGATLELLSTTISNCSAGSLGGAISVSESVLRLLRTNVTDCHAQVMGGGVYASSSTLWLLEIRFSDNTVGNLSTPQSGLTMGGAIAVMSSQVSMQTATLNRNQLLRDIRPGAAGLGGALYGFASKIQIIDLMCCDNHASRGGCIAVQGLEQFFSDGFRSAVESSLSIEPGGEGNALFLRNAASERGGAIFAQSCNVVSLAAANCTQNFGNLNGGCVYAEGVKLVATDLTLEENFAGAGAGLFWDTSAQFLLQLPDPIWTWTYGNQPKSTYGYGPFQATGPSQLNVLNPDIHSIVQLPGALIQPAIRMALQDRFSQVAADQSIAVSAEPLSILSGTTTVVANAGFAIFDALVLHAPPNSSVELHFTARFNPTSSGSLTMTLQVGDCPDGSAWDAAVRVCVTCPLGRFAMRSSSSALATCEDCQKGTVGNVSGSTTCFACPAGTTTSTPGSKVCTPCVAGFYQPHPLQDQCLPCLPGSEQPAPGATGCLDCTAGRYAAFNGTVQCQACSAGRFSNPARTDCRPCLPGEGLIDTQCQSCAVGWFSAGGGEPCKPCPPGSVNNQTGSSECAPCHPGSYQDKPSQSVCVACPVGRIASASGTAFCMSCEQSGYTLVEGQTHCLSCVDRTGFSCANGIAIVQDNFWPYMTRSSNGSVELRTVQCEPNRCPRGGFTLANSSTFACGPHRPRALTNMLCASCDDGYLALESGACIKCSPVYYAPLMLLVLLVCWLAIMLLHKLAQYPGGNTKTLLYFVSTALLITGPSRSWLRWLLPFNGAVSSSFLPLCILPLGAKGLLALDLLLCAIGWVLLWLTAVVRWWWIHQWRQWDNKSTGAWESASSSTHSLTSLNTQSGDPLCSSDRTGVDRASFWQPYKRTSLGLLIFTSSQVVSTLLRLVHCVTVESRSVLLAAPSVDCSSSSYWSWAWICWLLLACVTVALPLLLFLTLRSAHARGAFIQPDFVRVWGIFFESYKAEMYWFETVLLIRRSSVVFLSVMLWRHTVYRGVALILLCLLWLALHFFLKPHQSRTVNRVESLALLDLAVLGSLQLLQQRSAGGDAISAAEDLAVDIVSTVLIIPPAVALLIFILRRPLSSFKRKFARLLTRRDKHQPPQDATAVSLDQELASSGGYELMERS